MASDSSKAWWGDFGKGALGGAATGASAGAAVGGPWGAAIGAVGGAVAFGMMGAKAGKTARTAEAESEKDAERLTRLQMSAQQRMAKEAEAVHTKGQRQGPVDAAGDEPMLRAAGAGGQFDRWYGNTF